jgi:hypothetical protein
MVNKIYKKIIYLYNIIISLKYIKFSYSQEGEDLILKRVLSDKDDGFFIDIGAHHPKRFSNTYLFYLKGWNGINIDPNIGIMKVFNYSRPRDINIEIGISKNEDNLLYYQFNEPALNTFDKNEAEIKSKNNADIYKITNIIKVKTLPLSVILDKYLKKNIIIDFMTIDVEGFDLVVLQSNNWSLYRPKILLVEELRTNIDNIYKESEINSFLKSHNYILYYRTYNTSFYKDNLID